MEYEWNNILHSLIEKIFRFILQENSILLKNNVIINYLLFIK